MNVTCVIRMLALADLNFRQARAMASLLCALKDVNHDTLMALQTGLVVSYARAFVGNYGIGALGEEIGEGHDPQMLAVHKELIQARNKIHAHRDRKFAESQRVSVQERIAYDVDIIFHEGLTGFDLVVSDPVLSDGIYPMIERLCDEQRSKIRMRLAELIEPCMDSIRFRPNRLLKNSPFA